MATITLIRLVQDTADHLGDCKLGTATAGAAGTLTDATRRTEDTNHWAGAFLYLYGGTGLAQERAITASATTGVMTVEANWTVTPDNTTTYEIHRLMERAEYARYVRLALEYLTHARRLLHHKLDVSLSWTTDQYDYTVPTGFVGIYEVQVADESGSPDSDEYTPVANERWSIRSDGTTHLIAFDKRQQNLPSGYKLRVLGYQEFPLTDASTYDFAALPLTLLAASLAAESLIGMDPSNHYERLADRLFQRAERAAQESLNTVINPATRWIFGH